jgi:hypothetical protein
MQNAVNAGEESDSDFSDDSDAYSGEFVTHAGNYLIRMYFHLLGV